MNDGVVLRVEGLTVHYDTVPDPTVASELFRIAQEATNNAMKHAKATQIVVELTGGDEGIVLTVRDDGVGIPDGPSRSGGMGTRIMRFRARAIGAALHVSRNEDGGTTVTCTVRSRP